MAISVPRRAGLATVAAVLTIGCSLGAQASAHAGKAARLYSKNAVFKAFGHQGLTLYDTGYNDFNPVIALASIKPHDGWSLGIYVFRTKKKAADDFNATAKQWKQSGMAVTQIENIVITAVPKGASLSRPAKPWPMPQLVLNAIAGLTGKKT